jgi:hypothetical protein
MTKGVPLLEQVSTLAHWLRDQECDDRSAAKAILRHVANWIEDRGSLSLAVALRAETVTSQAELRAVVAGIDTATLTEAGIV